MFEEVSREMMDFIVRSPSCFHVVENLAGQLRKAGFQELPEQTHWAVAPGGAYFTTRNGSALIAFRAPQQKPVGFLIAAAHSDAPCLKLKPLPERRDGHYVRLNVEKYGGAILRPWMDRPLSVAGRVLVEDEGGVSTRLVCIDRDLLLIPSLAIHMDPKVNEGTALNPQVDMLPLFGSETTAGAFGALIAKAADVEPERILDADLFTYVRESGRIWGGAGEFIASPRLDDLQCVWAAAQAVMTAASPTHLDVCAVFDNEEVGSGTKQGACGTFLADVLERAGAGLGMTREERLAAIPSSLMLSADNGHAIHPNHPEKADEENHPHLNGGVVIKYSANQRYTSDGVSAALFRAICKRENIPVQVFANRSDMPGGSTLGNLSSAQVSLNTVDIGLAQLAMHAPVETAGVRDTAYLKQALTAFYGSTVRCTERGAYLLGD